MVFFCFLFCLFVCFQIFRLVLFLFIFIFIYLFMALLGLRFCARAFSSCGKRGPLFIMVRVPLIIAASLVAEHRLQTRRLSNCGSRAQLLRSMWDLPRPGVEPVSPALADRFSTTAPPGKPQYGVFVQRTHKTGWCSVPGLLQQNQLAVKLRHRLPHRPWILNLFY